MARPSAALALVLDVSASMRPAALARARALAAHALANVAREGKKKDLVHLSACGADKSANAEFAKDETCPNVVEVLGPCLCDATAFRATDLAEVLQAPSSQETADVAFGIMVAQSALARAVGTKKYNKRIIYFTNGRGALVETLKQAKVEGDLDPTIRYEIVIVDDSGDEVDDGAVTTSNFGLGRLAALRELVQDDLAKHGFQLLSASEMEEELFKEHVGVTGQIAAYRGLLQISPSLGFHVQGFTKSSTATAPTMKKASKVQLDKEPECRENAEAAGVKREVFYSPPDNADEEVKKEDLVNGFRFGRQSIPFSRPDEELRVYETTKELYAIGFVPQEQVPPFYSMGKSLVFQAAPGLDRSRLGLSALIRALHQDNKAIVARFVPRTGNKVDIIALLPYISEDGQVECLVSRSLPFEQDVRAFTFESLADPKLQPGVEQLEAVRGWADKMMLGPSAQHQFVPENTLNPFLERLYHLLVSRARDPSCALTRDPPAIERLYSPDPAMLHAAAGAAEKLASKFKLKEVEEKKKSKRRLDDAWGASSDGAGGADGRDEAIKRVKSEPDDLLALGLVGVGSAVSDGAASQAGVGTGKAGTAAGWFGADVEVEAVGSVNPIKDFQAMLARNDSAVHEKAFAGLCGQIDLQLQEGTQMLRTKALSCLSELRKGAIDKYMHDEFNSYLKGLKPRCKGPFWDAIVLDGLSLITSDDTAACDVDPEEARAFLKEDALPAQAPAVVKPIDTTAEDEDFDDFD